MMALCSRCDCEIKEGDKLGKIGFYTNDIFDGFGIYCYSCSCCLIKDFEQNKKWEIYRMRKS